MKQMHVIKTAAGLRQELDKRGGAVGFVPTMGALHAGHLSLVERCRKECDTVVVSVFVNPTQFNDPDDLKKYPRTPEADLAMLEKAGTDLVFMPDVNEIYPEPDTRQFRFGSLETVMEGAHRPGHFNGVAQVVSRLFDIVKPDKAYFGEKDFQQLAIIKYVTANLRIPVEIIGCPIFREKDGLAMSSRNMLLTPERREAAPHIFRTISKAKGLMNKFTPLEVAKIIKKEIDECDLLETEYVEIINALNLHPVSEWDEAQEIQLCCAVYAGPIRLIDNIKLR